MEAARIEKTLRLASRPAELWPLVSNTDRINRALGLPALISSGSDPKDFSQTVRSSVLGLPLTWREPPFEYVTASYYAIVREFDGGPLVRFEGGLRLAADAQGTAATVHGALWPRWALARPLVRALLAKTLGDMAAVIARIDASLQNGGTFPAQPRTQTPVNEDLLAARASALRAARVDAAAAEKLIAHIRHQPDDALFGMRPFELADAWGLPRPAALAACLHAVKAGLLDLSWEVLCPNCAAPKESLSGLSSLKGTSHCGSCNIDYGVDFSASVELRFSVHPSVRAARSAVFCAGSPAHSRHAVAQLRLDGLTQRAVDLDMESRPYTVRCLLSKRAVRLRPSAEGPTTVSIDLSRAEGDELAFRPGFVRLLLAAGRPALVRVEKESWREAAATAMLVTTMQDFRDLFSAEVLAPGVEIGVKNLALLFTDLKGSTAMYERVGDATAYALVRDHFGWLTGIVAARRGALVKTIGDAVMAAFASGADALEAALDMVERRNELSALLAPRPPVVLKIGVHEGPSIAINAGGRLDYFGTMVNVAARVQNESVGGDVVVTRALYDNPAARAVITRRAPAEERFTIALKGLSGEFELWRLTSRARSP